MYIHFMACYRENIVQEIIQKNVKQTEGQKIAGYRRHT
jgi:hypothetical protein